MANVAASAYDGRGHLVIWIVVERFLFDDDAALERQITALQSTEPHEARPRRAP